MSDQRPLFTIMFKRSLFTFAALGLLLSALLYYYYVEDDVAHLEPAVLAKWRSYYPYVVSPSPDASQILIRTKSAQNRDGLAITRAGDKEILHVMESSDPLMRAVWRPDGKALAYFRQEPESQGRELFVWDLVTDRAQKISIPFSKAQPIVKWSPDGSALAFVSDPGGLFIVNTRTNSSHTFTKTIKSFDWSDDSSRLVVAVEENSLSTIYFIGREGEKLASVQEPRESAVQEVVWRNGNSVLVLLHRRSDSGALSYHLVEASFPTFSNKTVFKSSENIRDIHRLAFNQGVLWHSQENEYIHSLYLLGPHDSVPKRLTKGSEAYHFRTFAKTGEVVCARYSQSSNDLISVSIDAELKHTKIAGNDGSEATGIQHRVVKLRAREGGEFNVLLSEVKSERSAHAAFVRVHAGGTISLALERWAETQFMLDYGIHVVHVASVPNSSSGKISAVCAYLQNVLRIPRERIVLHGSSSATSAIMETIAEDPSSAEIISLEGYLGWQFGHPVVPNAAGQHFKVLAFHGGRDDTLPPGKAHDYLVSSFGAKAITWRVFEQEQHWLLDDSSQALIHSMIIEKLGIAATSRQTVR